MFTFMNYSLQSLIDNYKNGVVVIPKHQRNYIWKDHPKFVDDLIEALISRRMIGVLRFNDVSNLEIDKKDSLVHRYDFDDGQQRFLTCYHFVQGTTRDKKFKTKTVSVPVVSISRKKSREIFEMCRTHYIQEKQSLKNKTDKTSLERTQEISSLLSNFENPDFKGKKLTFKELPAVVQLIIKSYSFAVHIEENMTAEDKVKYFIQVQNQAPLKYGDQIWTLSCSEKQFPFAAKWREYLSSITEENSENPNDPFYESFKVNNDYRELMEVFIATSCIVSKDNSIEFGCGGNKILDHIHQHDIALSEDTDIQTSSKNIKNFLNEVLLEQYSYTNHDFRSQYGLSKTWFKCLLAFCVLDNTMLKNLTNQYGIQVFLESVYNVFAKAREINSKFKSDDGFDSSTVVNFNEYKKIFNVFMHQHNAETMSKFSQAFGLLVKKDLLDRYNYHKKTA